MEISKSFCFNFRPMGAFCVVLWCAVVTAIFCRFASQLPFSVYFLLSFRINKKGSQKDAEQKRSGNYFFYDDGDDEEVDDDDI